MSKQLAISAAFSVFAMAAFVLFATPGGADMGSTTMAGSTAMGAKAEASAPIFERAAALPFTDR